MFTEDSRTANFLIHMGVQAVYTNSLTFADLSKGWQEHNLARPVPRREEAIVEYAALMDRGSPAPAPILHKTKSGLLDVLDGVQRLAAADLLSYTKLSAYVVTCDSDDVVTAIRVLANARLQGRAEPAEWTRRRAVEVLVVGKGLSVAEVAKMGGWRPADVERIAKVLGWGARIRDIGGPEELSDAMVDMISQYTTQEELVRAPGVVAEFLCVLKQAQFSAADAAPYLEKFFLPIAKASKYYEVYKERLDAFKQDEEVMVRILGRRGTAMRHDVNLMRLLKSASTVLDELALSDQQLNYADEFFRLINTLKDKLHTVSKNRKPVQTRTPADKWAKSNE